METVTFLQKKELHPQLTPKSWSEQQNENRQSAPEKPVERGRERNVPEATPAPEKPVRDDPTPSQAEKNPWDSDALSNDKERPPWESNVFKPPTPKR